MAVNKVIVNKETKLDLTGDTVTANSLLSGITAHDKSGSSVTGTLVVQSYYTGASQPDSSVGTDGDLYLIVEE